MLFGRYWGWTYLAWIGAVGAALADIAVNRGRITTAGINLLGGAIGSLGTILPC
jgi:hypothetical protein